MPAGPKIWTEEVIAQRQALGHGQGVRSSYVPWIRVQEFASLGTQTRVPSLRLKRTIHTFSYIERSMYLYLEYLGEFTDYREQYPMDRRITLGAAQALRIRHPRYPRSTVPLVMMLDALLTVPAADGRERLIAWDAKPSDKLAQRRIQEKLSLHRAYCQMLGIEHHLFTEKSVPRNVVRSIELARSAMPTDDEPELVPGLFTVHAGALLVLLERRHRKPIWKLCSEYDQAHRLPTGSALRAFYYLVWTKRVSVDLDVDNLPSQYPPLVRRVEHRAA